MIRIINIPSNNSILKKQPSQSNGSKVEKMPKPTKGHCFVKSKDYQKSRITCTFSDQGETFCKVSNQFDKKCGRSCKDNVKVSKGHTSNSIKNPKTNIKKISNQSNERPRRSCGDKTSVGRKDRKTDAHTDGAESFL